MRWTAATNGDGYGVFVSKGAHRHAWTYVYGPIPDGMLVCHTCDVPACVNPAHLRLGTFASNNRERDERGRGASGARHYRAKLNKRAADEIRTRYDPGDGSYAPGRKGRARGNAVELMAEFGIGRSTLYRVMRNELWT